MTAAETNLRTPRIKGRLRTRPPASIQRARAVLLGILSVVLLVAALVLVVALLFRVASFGPIVKNPDGSTSLGVFAAIWPAYVMAALAYVATRGYRDRRMWAFILSIAIGLVLVIGAAGLLFGALSPGTGGGSAVTPAASGAPAASRAAGGSGAPVSSVAAGGSVAPVTSGAPAASGAAGASPGASGAPVVAAAGTKDNGNLAFGMGILALFFLSLGLPLLWSLFKGRNWFLNTESRHPIKTAEEIEAESGGAAAITATELVPAGDGGNVTNGAGSMPQPVTHTGDPLVSVRGLKKHFPIFGGILRRQVGTIYALDGVDFDVYPGEVFSVVGESGCGKTTLGRTLLQLTPPTDGHVIFDGYELGDVDPDDMRPLRRRMQIIFQDPFGSLNPRMPVSDIIGEGLLAQGVSSRKERDKRVEDALEIVGLRRDYTRRYPHEFSGGQRQRIGIARALALSPDFVVCDEPVSALDVSIQSQVLNLLLDLKRDFNLTYLFISHNLSVVEYFSDRIAVMYLGKVVELGTVDELYRNPRHPYTIALLSAIPIADPRRRRRRLVLKGDVPSPAAPPSGCRFHTRCWLRERLGNPERCVTEDPALRPIGAAGHTAACHFSEEISDTVIQESVEKQSLVETAAAAE